MPWTDFSQLFIRSDCLCSGHTALRTKRRQLVNIAHLKRSIIEVKVENNCLAHTLIIAIARMKKDPNYESYRNGYIKNTSCN